MQLVEDNILVYRINEQRYVALDLEKALLLCYAVQPEFPVLPISIELVSPFRGILPKAQLILCC